MSGPLFDETHLRVAAKVRANASRHRWLNLAATSLVLLILALGMVLSTVLVARIVLHVSELLQYR